MSTTKPAWLAIGIYLALVMLLTATRANEWKKEEEESAHNVGKRMIYNGSRSKYRAYSIQTDDKNRIQEYKRIMGMYESQTCVRFISDPAKLKALGMTGNVCTFVEGGRCIYYGPTIQCCSGNDCAHEIGHMLGFGHEQLNPRRDGWIRVNHYNMREKNYDDYYRLSPSSNYNFSLPFDLSSAMLYPAWGGINGPIWTKLFPELPAYRNEYYYMLYEISSIRECSEDTACHGSTLKCVNDGFRTVVNGKCGCMCPPGLSPYTGCSTPLKKLPSEVKWPKGQYALPMVETGCPDESFQEGEVVHYGEGRNGKSGSYHLKGEVTNTKMQQFFCTRTVKDDDFTKDSEEEKFNWPYGRYCIFRAGGKCPGNLYPGHIQYGDLPAKDGVQNSHSGALPDGEYGANTRMELCCQNMGFTKTPAVFPNKKPFALLMRTGECQQIYGMRAVKEDFKFDNFNAGGKFSSGGEFVRNFDQGSGIVTVSYCYYYPIDRDCGSAIVLDSTNRTATIEVNSAGRTDMDCTWVVTGQPEAGTVVLDFEHMDVKTKSDGGCSDVISINHARIGSIGLNYCGRGIGHSIRTVFNKALIHFVSYGNSGSSFKLNIKWTPDNDFSYSTANRGTSYVGKAAYTRTFLPCLPWSDAIKCMHNPFQRGDELKNLEKNYCRNPDNSFRPWCYTNFEQCQRNYCDVDKLEVPYDKIGNCKDLRPNGFCNNTANALRYCAATCIDQIPPTDLKKVTEIHCDRPVPPSDSEIVGETKSKYNVGDRVSYKCKQSIQVKEAECLSDGKWTEITWTCIACAEGYRPFNGSCYQLMDGGRRMSYNDATIRCKNVGGSIAMPLNIEHAKFIRGVSGNLRIWLPITDYAGAQNWVLPDGSHVGWTNWLPGQPDNTHYVEHCARNHPDLGWNDVQCWWTTAVVCAIPMIQNSPCMDVQPKHCLKVLESRPSMCQDFPEYANAHCKKTCGICEAENIGCSVAPTNPDVSVSTLAATIPVGSSVTYSCNKLRYPIGGNQQRACQPDGQLSGKPLQCGDCPKGFVEAFGSCYGLMGKVFNSDNGRGACRDIGGYVASPRNQAENDLIASVGLNMRISIGVLDIEREGTYVLDNGRHMKWSNWAKGHPLGENEDCAVMNKDKQWESVNCHSLEEVVCAIPRTDPDACFNFKDRGASYGGQVNVSGYNDPCLSWAKDVKGCPQNAFKLGDDLQDNLFNNYCRNPDNSAVPWCYISTSCVRRDCDVCNTETADKGTVKNYLQVTCKAPTPPADGEIVMAVRSEYAQGEKVEFKCKHNRNVVSTTCLTTGDWSGLDRACQGCPIGWTEFNDNCYLFIKKKMTNQDAVKLCKSHGATLPIIRNQKENDFLLKFKEGYDIWMGAFDFAQRGIFVWMDGSPIGWTNWGQGQPSTVDHCTIFAINNYWRANTCDIYWKELTTVCALKKGEHVTCADSNEKYCSSIQEVVPGMCTHFPEFAERTCIKTCGYCGAANVRCPVQAGDTNVLVSTTSVSIPIGASVKYSCTHGYISQGESTRYCKANGQLTGVPVKCEKACPHGYKNFQNKCYKLIQNNVRYIDAVRICHESNAILASPQSSAENDFVTKMIPGGKAIWIGLTDREVEGTFKWSDGTKVTWNHWSPGEPNDWRRDEDCAVLSTNYGWNDISCWWGRSLVMCQVPMNSPSCNYLKNKGHDYNGKINSTFTSVEKPCVPWISATNCPHHPFKNGDELNNLEENYCRNPDNSPSNWCYTDAGSCTKNYCDVCRDAPETVATCSTPKPPSGQEVVGQAKDSYQIGETVSYKCKDTSDVATSSCLTSGDWSFTTLTCPGTCQDLLGYQCDKLVGGKPSMCDDYKDFAKKFCPKTCNVCGSA